MASRQIFEDKDWYYASDKIFLVRIPRDSTHPIKAATAGPQMRGHFDGIDWKTAGRWPKLKVAETMYLACTHCGGPDVMMPICRIGLVSWVAGEQYARLAALPDARAYTHAAKETAIPFIFSGGQGLLMPVLHPARPGVKFYSIPPDMAAEIRCHVNRETQGDHHG